MSTSPKWFLGGSGPVVPRRGFMPQFCNGRAALGLAMRWSWRAEALANPIFLLLRHIPPRAWIPLALRVGPGDANCLVAR